MASTQPQFNSLQHYFAGIPVVTKLLFGINISIYLVDLFFAGSSLHNASLSAAAVLPPNYEVFRMITYAFVHASFLHVLMNMLALLQLGSALEQQFGSLPFLALTGACGASLAVSLLASLFVTH